MLNVEVGDYVLITEEGIDKIVNGLWLKENTPYLVIKKSISGQIMIVEKGTNKKSTILNKEKKFLTLAF